MGKKTEWPPVARPHAASGQMRVRWEKHDYYLGPIDSAAARENYAALIVRLEGARADVPAPPTPDRPTVALVLARWAEHAAETFGAKNPEVQAYEDSFAQLRAKLGGEPADGLDCDRLEEVRDAMIAAKLCRNVVNRRIGRIKTAWRWAERRKLVPKGSWAGLRALPPLRRGEKGVGESPKVRPAEWRDVAAICRAAWPSVRGLLLAQWFTGARPGELWDLRVGEIVRCSAERERHKNAWRGHSRTLQFGPRAMKAIARLVEGKEPGDLVFPNRDGRPYNRNSYRLACVRAADRAGAARTTPYRLRHSAKRRFTQEMGLDFARAMLGQASLSTTDKYAASGDEAAAKDVARRCG